jgi:hypothetical protein
MKKLITKEVYTKSGYIFTVQKVGKVSHLQIVDSNCYPDTDSRYHDYWRRNGLVIPINDDENVEEISKLFKFKNNE